MTFPNRMFLVTLYLRTNLTERQLAFLFKLAPSTVHDLIACYTPALGGLLGRPGLDRRYLYVVDGTLIPVHDRSMSAKSKNYRRSVNVQVVAKRADRTVVAVSEPRPGNRNDVVVWRESGLPSQLQGTRLIGDGGYRGEPSVTSPVRGPDGRIVRDGKYREFRRKRATAEHVLANMKCWQTLRQIRRRGRAVSQTVQAVAVMHNLRCDPNWELAA